MRWSRVFNGLLVTFCLTGNALSAPLPAANTRNLMEPWSTGFVKIANRPGGGAQELSYHRAVLPKLPCPDKHARCTWERTYGGALEYKAHAITVTANGRIWVAG